MTEVKLLIRALGGEVCTRPPVWLMRQAGRYLPEYRQLRSQARNFLDFCYTPDLAVEATLQPIRRYGLDAAILFSDILVVPDALGATVRFVEGEGPKLKPLTGSEDVKRLDGGRLHDHLAPVYETLRRLRRDLPPQTALIGFAGAPWTLAAYMVEGGGSKDFAIARTMARREPAVFAELIARLSDALIEFLSGQVEAGAEVLQLFDSWAGVLPPSELDRWVVAPNRQIVHELRRRHPGVPVICFPRGIGAGYAAFAETVSPGGLGLDTTVPMVWAAASLHPGLCLQGNLDPIALLGREAAMLGEADAILEATRGRPHVFNLGHGVLPQTDPDAVGRLVAHLQSAGG
jgi:uroporphyrinogen decarboxylase